MCLSLCLVPFHVFGSVFTVLRLLCLHFPGPCPAGIFCVHPSNHILTSACSRIHCSTWHPLSPCVSNVGETTQIPDLSWATWMPNLKRSQGRNLLHWVKAKGIGILHSLWNKPLLNAKRAQTQRWWQRRIRQDSVFKDIRI